MQDINKTLSQGLANSCANCHVRAAETRRRLVTSVGTLGLPEPVCRGCARLVDGEREREARGSIDVDRLFRRPGRLDDDLVGLVREAA
jgi:hypothetical protein